ncbi:MFS family permease [Salinibacterium sp. CAN_S4]
MSLLPGKSALRGKAGAITFGLIGYLFLVEIVSGILQGYYVPLITDLVTYLGIRDADFNWFEAAQLLLSALVVPVLAKLGDMYGHKKILLISTVLTALASWGLVLADNFVTFLIAWALQGFYVVWLPLEVALIFDRGRRTGRGASQTRKAAGFLVVALEAGAIIGALLGGRVFGWTGENVPVTLMIPAIAVTLVFFAILFGVPESTPLPGRSLDFVGFSILTIGLLLITSGLTFLRLNGLEAWWVYLLIAAGIATFIPFTRYELRQKDPAIDLRVLAQPNMWPVQLTAFLIGISLLGAQAPLSAYAGTDPANGYGLGLDSTDRSTLIGVYLISMIGGALLFPIVSRRLSPKDRPHHRRILCRSRIPAVHPVPPRDVAGVPEHVHRRHRVGRSRRRHAGCGGRCGAAGPDRGRRSAHEHDEDHRRIVRLGDLRNRAGDGSREPGGKHGVEPLRLHDRVVDLRNRCTRCRGAAVPGAETRVRRRRRCARTRRGQRVVNSPLMTLCGAAWATGLIVTRSRFT